MSELTHAGEPGGAAAGEQQASVPLKVMTSDSSWKASRIYLGSADQLREVRAFLGEVLHGCPMADDAVLLASEIAANAVQHSDSRKPGGEFTVRAEAYEGDYLCVEVEDQGGPWTVPEARSDGRGHGLRIVGELADDWGCDGDATTGWAVWFRLDWPPDDRPALYERCGTPWYGRGIVMS
jgi:anti-sigma regulatory factor (Ser/Thr protein kinase)